MMLVSCEPHPGYGSVSISVAVRDINNVQSFLEVDKDFVSKRQGKYYLPVGLVYKDKEKGVALIEFPEEAASGAHRIWVPLSSLIPPRGEVA